VVYLFFSFFFHSFSLFFNFFFVSLQSPDLAKALKGAEENCRSSIGRIELVMDNKIERVYFPIPSHLFDNIQGDVRRRENVLKRREVAKSRELEDELIEKKIEWRKGSGTNYEQKEKLM
jgi:hypothetical protein